MSGAVPKSILTYIMEVPSCPLLQNKLRLSTLTLPRSLLMKTQVPSKRPRVTYQHREVQCMEVEDITFAKDEVLRVFRPR